jgi:hypothetical protein
MTVVAPLCPLCANHQSSLHFEEGARRYFRCVQCGLIHLEPAARPSRMAERRRYLEHRNSASDPGYVNFLRALADPVCAVVPVGARGLDFGCGPVPVLAELLTAGGRPTVGYDPIFQPDASRLKQRYDFVTCSEVVEHAHDPAKLFAQLGSLVRAGGTIGIMTQLYDEVPSFEEWWYRRDITHVCFYHTDTMRWVAAHYRWPMTQPAPNVVLFTPPR